jgi:hypothetical protein
LGATHEATTLGRAASNPIATAIRMAGKDGLKKVESEKQRKTPKNNEKKFC